MNLLYCQLTKEEIEQINQILDISPYFRVYQRYLRNTYLIILATMSLNIIRYKPHTRDLEDCILPDVLVHLIVISTDNDDKVISSLIDLEKSVDLVDHRIIYCKLESLFLSPKNSSLLLQVQTAISKLLVFYYK